MIVYLALIFSSPRTSGFDLLIFYLRFLIYDILFSWTVPAQSWPQSYSALYNREGGPCLSLSLSENSLEVDIKLCWRKCFTVGYFITRNNTYVSKNMGKWKSYNVYWKTPNLGSQYGKNRYAKKKHRKEICILIVLIVVTTGGKSMNDFFSSSLKF